MDKNGLGPVLDDNGNVMYETTKEDKIVIYADTLLGLGMAATSASLPGGRSRDHTTIDMPLSEEWSTTAADYARILGQGRERDSFVDARRDTNPNRSRSAPEKLRLHHVCVSANECVDQLEKIRFRLAQFASRDEQMARGEKVLFLSPSSIQLADLAYQIMSIAREAFVPSHRLCSAVIGLYMTEDYIREPVHADFPDYYEGRIRIPTKRSNRKTLLQLHMCVDTVTELYAKFQPSGPGSSAVQGRPKFGSLAPAEADEMRGIFLMMRHIIQELYLTGSGCFDLLNILLYVDPPEKEAFAGFLNNLNSMEKSDLLEGVSKLRRTVDHIPLLFEKLSWASYTVFRLASGNSAENSPIQSGLDTPNLASPHAKLEIPQHKLEALAAQQRSGTRARSAMKKSPSTHSLERKGSSQSRHRMETETREQGRPRSRERKPNH